MKEMHNAVRLRSGAAYDPDTGWWAFIEIADRKYTLHDDPIADEGEALRVAKEAFAEFREHLQRDGAGMVIDAPGSN